MSNIDIWFLALALAMDCFAVSIASGVIIQKKLWGLIFRIAFLFGFFQAIMPVIGWLGISVFSGYLEKIDHWISFGILAFLGGRMIRDAFLPEEDHKLNPRNSKTQLMLAIATSIDALAVGISFACMGYHHIYTLTYPIMVIGLVSFVMSVVGFLLGIKFGLSIQQRLKPELFGGCILIIIGTKVLLSHLMG